MKTLPLSILIASLAFTACDSKKTSNETIRREGTPDCVHIPDKDPEIAKAIQTARDSMIGFWKVNWEKTAPTIQAVPQTFTHRVKTAEEFREFVADRANGLVLEIQPTNSAVMYKPSGESQKLVWRSDTKYDIWLEQKIFMSASIGHGFKISGANTAILTFQIEWNENVATRVQLFMERQQPNPANPK